MRKNSFSPPRMLMALLGFMVLSTGMLRAQTPHLYLPNVAWAQTYNNNYGASGTASAEDWALGITSTSDGGSLISGFTWSGTDATGSCYAMGLCVENEARSPYIIKVDGSGNVTDEFIYDGASNPAGCSLGSFWESAEISDGYVVCGYDGSTGLLVAKLSKTSLSTVLNSYTLPSAGAYSMKKVYKIVSGAPVEDGFIVSGLVYGLHFGVTDFQETYIVRLDNDLNFIWDKTITQDHYSRSYSVVPVYAFGTNVDGTPAQQSGGGYGSSDIVVGFAMAGEFDHDPTHIYSMAMFIDNTSAHTMTWETLLNAGNGSTNVGKYEYSTDVESTWSSYSTYNRFSNAEDINCSTAYTGGDISDIYSSISTSSPMTTRNIGRTIIQTHDGSLAMVSEFNEFELLCSNGNTSFPDEYHEGELVLCKLDVSTGIPSGAKQIGQGSGGDYRPKVKETQDDAFGTFGYVVFSTSSDANVLTDLDDLSEYVLYKTDASFNPQWTDAIRSGNFGDVASCAFALDYTSDGGYVICGNNGLNNDDFAYAKLLNCEGTTPGIYFLPASSSGTTVTLDANATSGPTYDYSYHTLLGFGLKPVVQGQWVINGTVTLSNYTLYFDDTKLSSNYLSSSPNPTNIVINTGGHLILNHCTLRGIDGSTLSAPCNASPTNYMWDGITVNGNETASQSPTSNQGELELYGTIIRDARTAVSVGDLGGGNDGGIVIAGDYVSGSTYHTEFLDNEYGVSYFPYSHTGALTNAGSFTNCVFDCDGPLKDYGGAGVHTHMYLYGIAPFATFAGNTFENTGAVYPNPNYGCNGQGTGIYAYNTTLDINDPIVLGLNTGCPGSSVTANTNTFEDLDYGIYIDGYGAYTNTESVWLCNFENDKQGLTVNGNDQNPSFGLNYFYYSNVLPDLGRAVYSPGCASSAWGVYTGLRITNCPQFTVTNNRLEISPTVTSNFYFINGIWASHSGNHTTASGIYYTEFENLSALAATASPSLSYGTWTTGIRIDDITDGGLTKIINLYGNGTLNTSLGSPNANLHNYYDLYVDDPEFKQTPFTTGQGVENIFTTSTDAALSKQIYNALTSYTFDYNSQSLSASSPAYDPLIYSAHVLPSAPFTGFTAPTNYSMCTNVMPTSPDPNNADWMNGKPMEDRQQVMDLTKPGGSEMSLEIIPNPFQDAADIRYTVPAGYGNATLDIFDALGHKVQNMVLSPDSHDQTLYSAGLKPGLYYYAATAQNNARLNGKFVVVNP